MVLVPNKDNLEPPRREVPSAPPLPRRRPQTMRPTGQPAPPSTQPVPSRAAASMRPPQQKDPYPNLRPLGPRPVKPQPTGAAQPLQIDEQQAYTEGREARVEHIQKTKSQRKRNSTWKRLLLILLVLALLGGIAAGTYWYFVMRDRSSASITAQPETSQQEKSTTPADNPAPIDTVGSLPPGKPKEYSSTNFAVDLSYPDNWTLSDTPEVLSIVSPKVRLTGVDSQPVDGAIVFSLRNKQTDIKALGANNATAVLSSEKLTYAAPAAGQRGQTYISFVQYPTATKGTLNTINITGNNGYQKAQTIPKADLIAIDPFVTVSFVACSANCLAAAPELPVSSTVWNDTAIKKAIEDIFKSLAIS